MDHHIKGNEAFKHGNYKMAWEEYTKALLKTPKNPILWCNRAQTCLKGGWPELSLLDAKRAEKLLLNKKDDPTRQKILFKAKCKYAEALSALGIPTLAKFAYEELIKFMNELDDHLINEFDRKVYEEKRNVYQNLTNEQNNVFDQEEGKDNIMITDEDNGWYKFSGKYPWDDRFEERWNSSVLQKFQRELDIASNGKLQVTLVDFGIGIIAKQDLSINQIIFENDPFLAAHNHYELRCDYCIHLLLNSSNNELGIENYSEYPKRFSCPNPQCEESFCNKRCYLLAMNSYHKQLCGKNIKKIIEFSQTDANGNGLLCLLTLKLFAFAKNMNICPLDIEEIKYLYRYKSIQDFQDGYDIWESKFEEIYMEVLNVLDIFLYDIKYDFWIFITILNILKPNVFDGPPRTTDEKETDTIAIFPLASLINHNCNPNSSQFEILSEPWIKYDYIDKIKEIRTRVKSNYKNCHSLRMFIENMKAIKTGEQIFISYCDEDNDKEERQAILLGNFGFKCRCLRCKNEVGDYKQKQIAWDLYFPDYNEK